MSIDNVREYVRQRRRYSPRGMDPEAVHGVLFDNSKDELTEITMTDLEELLALADLFSSTPTEMSVSWLGSESDPLFLQSGVRAEVYFGPDKYQFLAVATTSDGFVEISSPSAGPLEIRPTFSNVAKMRGTR